MSKISAKKGTAAMRKCAFCCHWYDPTNSAIAPKAQARDWWEYTSNIKNPCLARQNIQMNSHSVCPKFECKI